MEIKVMTNDMISDVVKLWNENVYNKSIMAEWNEEDFKDRFIDQPCYDKEGFLVLLMTKMK